MTLNAVSWTGRRRLLAF